MPTCLGVSRNLGLRRVATGSAAPRSQAKNAEHSFSALTKLGQQAGTVRALGAACMNVLRPALADQR